MLRKRYGIADDVKVVGNANFIYPPKWYLRQRKGLKAHEDVIDALALVIRKRPDVVGVLIGGSFPEAQGYERRLRERARDAAGDRILMTGYTPVEEIRQMWPDFDVAVHVPTSENCGGVLEPLLASVPTIAGRVGGLPELVIEGVTGKLVGIRDPCGLAGAILEVLDNRERYIGLASAGRDLLLTMFDVRRTAREVMEIYRHILDHDYPRPPEFDSEAEMHELSRLYGRASYFEQPSVTSNSR
jgi:glycosyltransferase involved in cell wall biosynthesis